MNTNGNLSVLGVHQFFPQFSMKQKFDMINLVQGTGSGPGKLTEVLLIPGSVVLCRFCLEVCVRRCSDCASHLANADHFFF